MPTIKRKRSYHHESCAGKQREQKRLYQSIVCGIITIIAVCALIIIAAYIGNAHGNKDHAIVIAVITAAAGISAAATLDVNAGHFQCPDCGHLFVPEMKDYVKAYHTVYKTQTDLPSLRKNRNVQTHNRQMSLLGEFSV